MDAIKLPLALLILGGFIFFLFTNMDTSSKVDVNTAEVLAQIAQQDADMAAFRNGGKPVPEFVARAKSLRGRADKIAAEAEVKKIKRESVLDHLADWFRDILSTSNES